MRIAAICVLALVAGASSASACDDRFTAADQKPGAAVVELPRNAKGRRDKVTIATKGVGIKRYDLTCGGSPAVCVLIEEGKPDGERIGFDEPEDGVLTIGDRTFKPYCK